MKGAKVYVILAVALVVVALVMAGCYHVTNGNGFGNGNGDDTTEDTTTDTTPDTVVVDPEVSEGSVVEGAVLDYDYEGYEDPYTAENLNFDFHTPLPGKVGDSKQVSWYFNTELEHYGGVAELDVTDCAIYYGYESVSDEDLSLDAYPMNTEAYDFIFNDDASYDEGTFQEKITYTQEGKLYLRGYAVVNGYEVWTEERSVNVFAASE